MNWSYKIGFTCLVPPPSPIHPSFNLVSLGTEWNTVLYLWALMNVEQPNRTEVKSSSRERPCIFHKLRWPWGRNPWGQIVNGYRNYFFSDFSFAHRVSKLITVTWRCTVNSCSFKNFNLIKSTLKMRGALWQIQKILNNWLQK